MTDYFFLPSGIVGIIFLVLMLIAVVMLWKWQMTKDDFDLRDAITAPQPDGARRVETSKFILVGTFLVSSYLIADNYSDTALGVYLGAWVINGGAVLLFKVFNKPVAAEPVDSLIK
jgi:hypothetical protein